MVTLASNAQSTSASVDTIDSRSQLTALALELPGWGMLSVSGDDRLKVLYLRYNAIRCNAIDYLPLIRSSCAALLNDHIYIFSFMNNFSSSYMVSELTPSLRTLTVPVLLL